MREPGQAEALLAILLIGGIVLTIVMARICWQKGKHQFAIWGIFIGQLHWFGVFRLAKPGSPWAKKNYPPGSWKDKESRERYPEESEESPPPRPSILMKSDGMPLLSPTARFLGPTPPSAEPEPPPEQEWTPTHRIPEGGLVARERPDPYEPKLLRIKAGEEVRVLETAEAWARIVTVTGWEAWVEAEGLVWL